MSNKEIYFIRNAELCGRVIAAGEVMQIDDEGAYWYYASNKHIGHTFLSKKQLGKDYILVDKQ